MYLGLSLLCLVVLVTSYPVTGPRTLVLVDDLNIKTTHSNFF